MELADDKELGRQTKWGHMIKPLIAAGIAVAVLTTAGVAGAVFSEDAPPSGDAKTDSTTTTADVTTTTVAPVETAPPALPPTPAAGGTSQTPAQQRVAPAQQAPAAASEPEPDNADAIGTPPGISAPNTAPSEPSPLPEPDPNL